MERNSKRVDVVIVGAGAAGLGAAQHLSQNGFNSYVILEANSRIGGRVHTVQFGSQNHHLIELGANWIHGGSIANPLFTLAMEYSFREKSGKVPMLDRFENSYFATSNGKIIDLDIGHQAVKVFFEVERLAFNLYYRDTPLLSDTVALYGYLVNELASRVKTDFEPQDQHNASCVFNAMLNYLRFHVSDEMDRVSLKQYGTFQEIPGGDMMIPGGFQNLLQAVVGDLPPNCIQFNTEVIQILWASTDNPNTDSRLTIVCGDGSIWYANHVVLTVSIGYLKKHYQNLFSPQLPDFKIEAIQRIGFGCTNKIFLYFENPFWQGGQLGFIGVAWSDEELQKATKDDWEMSIYGFEEVYDNPNVLAAWIAGIGAETMESVSKERVKSICTKLLRRVTGNDRIPAPKEVRQTRWRSDPYALGSYSYASIQSGQRQIADLAAPLPCKDQPKILFAGEATHPCYYSTVHGAMLSGIREANTILQRNKVSKL